MPGYYGTKYNSLLLGDRSAESGTILPSIIPIENHWHAWSPSRYRRNNYRLLKLSTSRIGIGERARARMPLAQRSCWISTIAKWVNERCSRPRAISVPWPLSISAMFPFIQSQSDEFYLLGRLVTPPNYCRGLLERLLLILFSTVSIMHRSNAGMRFHYTFLQSIPSLGPSQRRCTKREVVFEFIIAIRAGWTFGQILFLTTDRYSAPSTPSFR